MLARWRIGALRNRRDRRGHQLHHASRFSGAAFSAGIDDPQHPGGKRYNGNFSFGTGDFEKDRFNLFGVIDYQKQDRISGSQRPFVDRLPKTSPTTFPGQYNQGGNVENPSFPGCNTPSGIPLSAGNGDKSCGYLYAREVNQIPDNSRTSLYLNGSFKVAGDTRLNVEYFVTRLINDSLISGVPYGALAVNPGTPYYPGNGITPLPTSFTLDPAYDAGRPGSLPGAVRVRWRDELSGGREDQDRVTQQRLVGSLEGSLAGWDYQTGLSANENHLSHNLVGGYTNNAVITPDILNGIINPFSTSQTAAGAQAIAGAAALGTLYNARGQVYQADGKASRDLGDFFKAGRPAAVAVGAEIRHERYDNIATPFAALVVSSTGFDPAINVVGERNVVAAFTELNVPIFSQLDVTAALRHDRYNDFGSTTNPKASFRYQPIRELLFRGSYSTGFRAPALFELRSPQTYTNSAGQPQRPGAVPERESDRRRVEVGQLRGPVSRPEWREPGVAAGEVEERHGWACCSSRIPAPSSAWTCSGSSSASRSARCKTRPSSTTRASTRASSIALPTDRFPPTALNAPVRTAAM